MVVQDVKYIITYEIREKLFSKFMTEKACQRPGHV